MLLTRLQLSALHGRKIKTKHFASNDIFMCSVSSQAVSTVHVSQVEGIRGTRIKATLSPKLLYPHTMTVLGHTWVPSEVGGGLKVLTMSHDLPGLCPSITKHNCKWPGQRHLLLQLSLSCTDRAKLLVVFFKHAFNLWCVPLFVKVFWYKLNFWAGIDKIKIKDLVKG